MARTTRTATKPTAKRRAAKKPAVKPAAGLPLERGSYLEKLRVENVRCFGEQQTLSLRGPDGKPARWTIILGENGVGKTTLLQLLAIGSEELALLRIEDTATNRNYPRNADVELVRANARSGWFRVETATSALAAMLKPGHGIDELELEEEEDDEGRVVPDPKVLAPLVVGYGASRRLGSAVRLGHPRRLHSLRYASLFADVALRSAEEWLLGADYAAAKSLGANGRATQRLEQLKELLVRLLPDVTAVRVADSGSDWAPAVEFKTPYGWVALRNLSLGYQSLVAWMVDFAAILFDHYPKHADPLAQPAVVLVDEIDLHLHPKWQRALMGFLTERFPATQFIATAHSPLVVQAAEGANIVLLRREGDQVVIENNPGSVRNWRIDQILTSDLYGLPTARPPRLDALIKQRRELLTKATLTTADRAKLGKLEEDIGELPGGETPEEQQAMSLLLRVAEKQEKRITSKAK